MNEKQSRFKSWVVVVTSILDTVLFVLVATGTLAKWGVTVEQWQTVVGMLGVVAANIFAALNNPTSAKTF